MYIDGPIAGKEFPVDSPSRRVLFPVISDSTVDAVVYTIKRFAIKKTDDSFVEFYT